MRASLLLIMGLLCASGTTRAGHPLQERAGTLNVTPAKLEEVGIDQKLGNIADFDIPFTDETGKITSLRKISADGKPILLSLAYYKCPQICNTHISAVIEALKKMPPNSGDQLHYVVVSIDPREKPELAAAKKESYLNIMGRKDFFNSIHFLSSTQESVWALAKQVGFKYRWDEDEKMYAHASAAIVMTPKGKISRYFSGIVFEPEAVRLSLIEAGQGRVGSFVDKLILYCFHWDDALGKYTVTPVNILRISAALIIIALGAVLIPFWLKQRRLA